MPKVLLLDIETAPMLGYVWSLYDQNVALNQIHSDWYIISWSAKWLDSKQIMYRDQRKSKKIDNDKALLKDIWKLIDEADILVTQNGKRFDIKKLNARFIINGMKPPSSYRHIDTLELAKKSFAFTSNKLEYMTGKLCKIKKDQHKKFPGFELWRECLKGNKAAWREMELYNKQDVLALEELYKKLSPWSKTVNFNVYKEGITKECSCGSETIKKNGYKYTDFAKYQRYRCSNCRKEYYSNKNLFSKEKRHSLKR